MRAKHGFFIKNSGTNLLCQQIRQCKKSDLSGCTSAPSGRELRLSKNYHLCHCEEALVPTWQSKKFRFHYNFDRKSNFWFEIATPLRARNDIIRTFLTRWAPSGRELSAKLTEGEKKR